MVGDPRNTAKWRALAKAVKAENPYCAVCGSEEDLHADHIIPWSKGGAPYDIDNIQVLCRKHNQEKSNKTIEQQEYTSPTWLAWEQGR